MPYWRDVSTVRDPRGSSGELCCRRVRLQNRTVDLLLTMYRSADVKPQVEQLTCRNTSTDRHSQAPDEPSRSYSTATKDDVRLALALCEAGLAPRGLHPSRRAAMACPLSRR